MPTSRTPKAHSDPDTHSDQAIRAVDALFERAGLVRNLRGKAAGVTRQAQARVERGEPDESAPPPVLRTAANGVQWLPVPAWEKPGSRIKNWLWHGFSTRLGGRSRAYCADDAPGEMNLGFTADDDREAVT